MLLKGTNPDFDSYSLFFDNGDNGALGSTGLDISLASKGVRTGKKLLRDKMYCGVTNPAVK